jgi:outer membrane protein
LTRAAGLTTAEAMTLPIVRTLSASVLALGMCFLSPAGVAEAADAKIGLVDVNRAVSQTEDGLRAAATLKKVFDNKQQELNKRQTDLQKQREDIEKQAKVVSKEALQKRMEDWQKQMMELQAVFVEYNKELEKRQKELTDPIIEKMVAIVKRIATSEGFDVVMERQAAAFVKPELDLTDRCIQMYNGGAGKPAATAPTAPAAAPKK